MNFAISLLCIMICSTNTINAIAWKKMCSYVIPQKIYRQVQYEEFTLKNGTFIVKNLHGNVQIRTSWESDKILLKATKKSYEEENLPLLTFTKAASGNSLTIVSQYDTEDIEGDIDFEIIVPHTIALTVTTQKGDILIEKVSTPAVVKTVQGNIEISQAQNTVKATTEKCGSILVSETTATVYANAADNVTIFGARSSVIVEADGKVEVHCIAVPSTALITIKAYHSIALFLPPTLNADLQAEAPYGSITSEQYITLKPYTMQLNTASWRQFKKEITGTIGTAEAQIKLSSENGSIRLLKEEGK